MTVDHRLLSLSDVNWEMPVVRPAAGRGNQTSAGHGPEDESSWLTRSANWF